MLKSLKDIFKRLEKRRYFLITYLIQHSVGFTINTLTLDWSHFPSALEIKKELAKIKHQDYSDNPDKMALAFISIHEFKNEEDWLTYTKISE